MSTSAEQFAGSYSSPSSSSQVVVYATRRGRIIDAWRGYLLIRYRGNDSQRSVPRRDGRTRRWLEAKTFEDEDNDEDEYD